VALPGPPSVTLGGPTPTIVTTGPDGIAISPSVTAGLTLGTAIVTASTPGATNASFSLNIVAGTAEKLAFSLEPPLKVAAGATFTAKVQLQDSNGTPVHVSGTPPQVTLHPISGTLVGTAILPTDGDGLATCSGLSVEQVGLYYLRADAPSIQSARSTDFEVTAGAAFQIQATGGTPQSTTILTPFSVPLQVTVRDQFGNPVSGF